MFKKYLLDKKPNLSKYASKKAYDFKNVIDFDEEISEANINIKPIPEFKPKIFNFDSSGLKFKNNNLSKFNHCNSITTITSYKEESVKKVTFSTVEIIRVKKYKKYNALSTFSKNLIKKNMEEMKQNYNNESNCSIF